MYKAKAYFRYGRDTVVRDGNGNRNSSPTFLFSVCGHPRIPRVSRIWTPRVGEKATMVREPGNEHDRFAVAVLEDKTLCTVGHLPWEIAKECFFFIRGGVIGVEVTGQGRSPRN